MLVLSRKVKEEIVIGPNGDIVLMIVDNDGINVRIGITADPRIPVHRREVFDAINGGSSDGK